MSGRNRLRARCLSNHRASEWMPALEILLAPDLDEQLLELGVEVRHARALENHPLPCRDQAHPHVVRLDHKRVPAQGQASLLPKATRHQRPTRARRSGALWARAPETADHEQTGNKRNLHGSCDRLSGTGRRLQPGAESRPRRALGYRRCLDSRRHLADRNHGCLDRRHLGAVPGSATGFSRTLEAAVQLTVAEHFA